MISQKADQGQDAKDEKKTNLSKEAEKRYLSKRSVTIIKTVNLNNKSLNSNCMLLELKGYTSKNH